MPRTMSSPLTATASLSPKLMCLCFSNFTLPTHIRAIQSFESTLRSYQHKLRMSRRPDYRHPLQPRKLNSLARTKTDHMQ